MFRQKMTAKNFDRWKATRRKSRLAFVLRYDLPWVAFTFVFVEIFRAFLEPDYGFTLFHLGLALIIWPLCGLAFGSYLWWMAERGFAERERLNAEEAATGS